MRVTRSASLCPLNIYSFPLAHTPPPTTDRRLEPSTGRLQQSEKSEPTLIFPNNMAANARSIGSSAEAGECHPNFYQMASKKAEPVANKSL